MHHQRWAFGEERVERIRFVTPEGNPVEMVRALLHGSIVLSDICDYGFCQGHRCQGHREESGILLLSSVTVLQLSKNFKQITDAMKLVAYAKLCRAQQAVVEAHLFSYALQGVFGDGVGRLGGSDAAELPLLKKPGVQNISIVIFGGDSGLCGAYNNQLITRTALRFAAT